MKNLEVNLVAHVSQPTLQDILVPSDYIFIKYVDPLNTFTANGWRDYGYIYRLLSPVSRDPWHSI